MLAANGTFVSAPPSALPSSLIDATVAEQAARHESSTNAVLSSTLVTLNDQSSHRKCVCWAVVLNPSTITSNAPQGHTRQQATFSVRFYDAQTGALVEGVEGSG